MKNRQRISWKKRAILFLISQCITLFGSTLVQMALVWYATMQTSSGAWVASFTICSYLPQFFISFLGGIWADRYNRKILIASADSLIAFVTLLMIFAIPLISSNTALLSSLLVMSAIRSLGAGIQTPAVQAVIPQLVPKGQLMRYNGIYATMQSIVNFAAPAAAGAVFSISTLPATLMIDVVTALLGTGLLSFLVLPKQNPIAQKDSLCSDIKTSVKYVFADKPIGVLLIVYGLFTFFCVPAGYLAGLLVRRTFGDTYWCLTAVELAGFAGMMAGGGYNEHMGRLSARRNDFGDGPFAFWILCSQHGLCKKLYPLFVLHVFLRSGADNRTNSYYHHVTGKSYPFHARACFWIIQYNVRWILAGWYGNLRPIGRYGPTAMDYHWNWNRAYPPWRYRHPSPAAQDGSKIATPTQTVIAPQRFEIRSQTAVIFHRTILCIQKFPLKGWNTFAGSLPWQISFHIRFLSILIWGFIFSLYNSEAILGLCNPFVDSYRLYAVFRLLCCRAIRGSALGFCFHFCRLEYALALILLNLSAFSPILKYTL